VTDYCHAASSPGFGVIGSPFAPLLIAWRFATVRCQKFIVDSEVGMASAGKAKKSGGRSTQVSVFNRHPLTVLMLASGMMPGWSLANDITLHTGSGGQTATTIGGCAEFCVTGDGVTTVAACLRS
jgi:hypothetical protein